MFSAAPRALDGRTLKIVHSLNVKHLVDKTIEFVHAFLEYFETTEEVLRDSTRVVVVIVLVY